MTREEALKQQPCDNCIIRQVVKEQMIKYGFNAPDMTVTEFVESLPPVIPQPKIGRWWERNTYPQESRSWDCSECQEIVFEKTNYCPNCGAKMEGEE